MDDNTIYHSKCFVLIRKEVSRCPSCQKYRSNLRALRSKCQKLSDSTKTDQNSHTNYRYLDKNELQQRLKNVQIARKTAERKVLRMNEKLKMLIDEEGIDLEEEDGTDMNYLIIMRWMRQIRQEITFKIFSGINRLSIMN